MKRKSVDDMHLVAALRRNCQRYKVELSDLRRRGGVARAIAALQTKLSDTEETIRRIERDVTAIPHLPKRKKHRPSHEPDEVPRREIGSPRMPALDRRNTLARLLYIAGKLRRGEPINGSSEARARGLSRKTLLRDFDFLREMGWQIDFNLYEKSYILLFAPPPRFF